MNGKKKMKKNEIINIIAEKLNRVDSYFQDQSEKLAFAEEILNALPNITKTRPVIKTSPRDPDDEYPTNMSYNEGENE